MIASFSINKNHKIALLSHPMGASGAILAFYLDVLMQKKLCISFIERISVLFIKQRWGTSGVTCAIHP